MVVPPPDSVPRARTGRRPLFIAAAVVFSVVLSCLAAELLVRLSGRMPWQPWTIRENEPTMHDPDAVLGWKPIAGRHVIAPYSRGGSPVQMTLRADGTRTTGGDGSGNIKLLFVGCSFTQGWAISDDETFTWRLQQRFPAFEVINAGVPAYGTYQALLVMERWLARPDPPAMVFYGLMEEHEPRNVGAPEWLMLLSAASKGGIVATPYCTLGPEGELIRHPTEAYSHWPLREYSALITFLERAYFEFAARKRSPQQRAVTERLLLEMQHLAQQHGSRFSVVLLHFSPSAKAEYVQFLEKHGIDYVDCAFAIDEDMHVRGDAHPNGKMNARYADCIATKIPQASETALIEGGAPPPGS